jgi:HSP20 family protein
MKLFSHNLLEDRELLKDLLKQIDMFNTINGGSVETSTDVIGEVDSILIKVSAPTVPAEAFSILLNYTKLTVSIFPKDKESSMDSSKKPVLIPMFMRTFDIPAFVDLDKIEAVHENGELRVTLPFKTSTENLLRMIEIKEI